MQLFRGLHGAAQNPGDRGILSRTAARSAVCSFDGLRDVAPWSNIERRDAARHVAEQLARYEHTLETVTQCYQRQVGYSHAERQFLGGDEVMKHHPVFDPQRPGEISDLTQTRACA